MAVHSWRRSLALRDSGRPATEIAELLEARATDYTTIAAELGVETVAVREADWYAARHIELAYAEARGDRQHMRVHAAKAA